MESTVVWQTRYSKKNTITDVIQPTLTLKVTTAQVVETSVTVNDNRLRTTFTRKIILNLLIERQYYQCTLIEQANKRSHQIF